MITGWGVTIVGAMLFCAASGARANDMPGVEADFAADFSTASAAAGDWQYGWSATLGGPLALASNQTLYGDAGQVVLWSPAGTYWPSIGLNTGASEVQFGGGNVIHLAAGQGLLHPGPAGEYAVARLTVSGSFFGTLQVSFAGIDTVGTTTDVHVLLNGAGLYAGDITGYGQTLTYTGSQWFTAGDQIDFAVGLGGNGHYIDDSTGFTASLTTAPVPEAPTLVLMAIGLAAVAAQRRRIGG
jgi:PEP-CTERM motif